MLVNGHDFDNRNMCIYCGCQKDLCPEECPKEPVSDDDKERIRKKTLDFRGSKWREYVSFMNWDN